MDADKLKARREAVAERIKLQAIMCNYGLPDNVDQSMPWLAKLNATEAQQRIKAIRELWVRLNLFVATGESSKGSIDFPEAKRCIEYSFVAKAPENSTVRFKALVRERRKR